MAKIKKKTITSSGMDVETLEPLRAASGTLENNMMVPQKIKIELSYDPAILLLGIYLKKIKTLIQKHICTPTH